MKTCLFIFVIFCLIILNVSCASDNVERFFYDRDTDFSNLRTFNWLLNSNRIPAAATRVLAAEDLDQIIKDEVDQQLQLKGFQKQGTDPDFFVGYEIFVEERMEVRHRGESSRSLHFEEGTLMLKVVDASTKETIWSGTASGIVEESRRVEQSERIVRAGIQEILENFPPRHP